MKGSIFRATAIALCLIVTGCGGGGGSNSGGRGDGGGDGPPPPSSPPPTSDGDGTGDNPDNAGYPTLHSGAARDYAERGEFQKIDPSLAEENLLRHSHNLPERCAGISNPDCGRPNKYRLQNIHYAHTATIGSQGTKVTGKGTLISVVDNGIFSEHEELSGKKIYKYPTNDTAPSKFHGTAVAAIAAGKADGNMMMGVAPDADLHLTQIEIYEEAIGGTNDAAARGAVVQNNSWGPELKHDKAADDVMAAFKASGEQSYEQFLVSMKLLPESTYRRLFDAYERFQRNGVIVYANSNESRLGTANGGNADVSFWAAAPLFKPNLKDAWIVVSNAYTLVDKSNGKLLEAHLVSAPCGSAAEFCLTSDGTVFAPDSTGGNHYETNTGTSFAAPQVTGMIALLAQAFPDLSPAEWTTRLLATARRDWSGFQNTIAGSTRFAPGVSRNYSRLFGHGIPDMKTALSPVGGLYIPNGDNVATASRSSLSKGIATAGPVVGNSVAKAIAGRSIMAIDKLGTNFLVSGEEINATTGAVSAPGSADPAKLARNVEAVAARFAFLDGDEPRYTAMHDAAVPKLFFSQSLASLGGEMSFTHLMPSGKKGAFLQFAGQMQPKQTGSNSAFSMSRFVAGESVATELSLSFGHSDESFFGASTSGPFMDARSSNNVATGFAVSKRLSGKWSISAYGELGSGFIDDSDASLADYGAFAYAGGGLSARRRGLAGDDMLDFYAGLRPTTIEGEAELRLPVGRDEDGTIQYDKIAVDLADADPPLRAGFVYRKTTARDFDIHFGLNADFVAAQDPDPTFSLSAGFKKAF